MSTIVLKLLETDSKFLEAAAAKVPDIAGGDWYHLPYWYKKVGEGLFVEYRFEDLPDELKNEINALRNPDGNNKSEVLY